MKLRFRVWPFGVLSGLGDFRRVDVPLWASVLTCELVFQRVQGLGV